MAYKTYNTKKRFTRAYRKLSPEIQAEVDETIRDLLKQKIPPGRRVEKLEGYTNVRSARVNSHFRLTFESDGDCFVLRNVGTHDKLYADP